MSNSQEQSVPNAGTMKTLLTRMGKTKNAVAVFLNPGELIFRLNSECTYEQELTIYNPYDYPVKYYVHTNQVKKYEIKRRALGIIPHAFDTVLIKYKEPKESECNVKDMFFITLCDNTNDVIGRRIITATLLPPEEEQEEEPEDIWCEPKNIPFKYVKVLEDENRGTKKEKSFSFKWLAIILILLLFLPTEYGEKEESVFPSFLHLGVFSKLMIAYFLGIVTSLLF